MPWAAITEDDIIDSGTGIRVEMGYSDVVPQNGHVVEVAHGATGRTTSLTVVSAAADRLELSNGQRYFELKPNAVKKENILDDDGRYRESWIVV